MQVWGKLPNSLWLWDWRNTVLLWLLTNSFWLQQLDRCFLAVDKRRPKVLSQLYGENGERSERRGAIHFCCGCFMDVVSLFLAAPPPQKKSFQTVYELCLASAHLQKKRFGHMKASANFT
jgi:hypothetical protein